MTFLRCHTAGTQITFDKNKSQKKKTPPRCPFRNQIGFSPSWQKRNTRVFKIKDGFAILLPFFKKRATLLFPFVFHNDCSESGIPTAAILGFLMFSIIPINVFLGASFSLLLEVQCEAG